MTGTLTAQLECHCCHCAIRYFRPDATKLAQPRNIRHRFDVEDEYGCQLLTCPGTARVLVVPTRLRFVDPPLRERGPNVAFPLRPSIGDGDFPVERSAVLVLCGHQCSRLRS